ncbi:MAG: response regulator transcription factor [Polaromonas sp.]|nr:response regulator transcription factor [Polaromonas sp.]
MLILLVDDHHLFSSGLRVLLQELSPGARISTAGTVAEAIACTDSFDLILLDLHLPDATGFDGLIRLKAHFEATPVVVVSSEENHQRIRECIGHGAMGFIPKTASAADLFGALTRILGGETYLPANCVAHSASPLDGQAPGIHLSPRQREVLMKVIQGKSNKAIARELGISEHTVKSHVMAVLAGLGVSNRTEAVYRAAAVGIAATTAG